MTVKTGLDVLLNTQLDLLLGQRVGVVTHPAAVTANLVGIVDALRAADVNLTALFGPEHGFDGSAADGAAVQDAVHPRTGLPIYSLYGVTQTPTSAMLNAVDALIFDMQDVGVRFYTYLSTLFHVLRGAAQIGKAVIVLDRPNPINGVTLEGPPVTPACISFVGILPIPIRHGMTLGELARYMNGEYALGADLTVIAMQGWARARYFAETGLPWVPTSPAMSHLNATLLYPGLCFLEGCNISAGRGTSLPFEICGAPWIDAYALGEALNALVLPGLRVNPTQFTPCSGKFADELCYGVQFHVTQRDALRPVTLGLYLIATLHRMYPQRFSWRASHFDQLIGNTQVRAALERGERVADIVSTWPKTLVEFDQVRTPYLLY
ncbi:MAG TPA: DUF1343 domain-containing protein [Thermoflexia bacterium]|nr:DUF1343 domain-containing protein [Thermoflexia bacterium]